MGGGGIPVSQMTNRQLIIAVPLVFVVAAANICLFAGAYVLEWSGSRSLSALLGYALVIAFFAAFLAYLETAFVRELFKRRRAGLARRGAKGIEGVRQREHSE
jgi:hypothetical protein